MFRKTTALLAALALGFSGCSSDDDDEDTPLQVNVQDDAYSPANRTIFPGQTITWQWKGSHEHSVTFDNGPTSATQTTGSYSRTFETEGTFHYQCAVHGAAMQGNVTVAIANTQY